jgi:hypothetical protein
MNLMAYKYNPSCSELRTTCPSFEPATPSPLKDNLEGFHLKIEIQILFYF